MASDIVLPPSLPQTAVARRNARLRAVAIATIPLFLYVIAASLRLWEPDLVPFGLRQAASVSEATGRAPISWLAAYADQTVSVWLLAEPVLRPLPSPVMVWVVLRGLLDSLAVPLLFLAARPLVGPWGATLAALLYAANPSTWAAARDPAGPLSAGLMAAALWAAVRVVQRPTHVRGVVFGVLIGLLARSASPALLVVPLGAVTLAFGRASWKVGGTTALALLLTAAPALVTLSPSSAPLGGPNIMRVWLSLPGWLVYGLAYQPPDGQAVGTTFLPVNALAVVILCTGLLAVSAGVVVWLAWRGRRALLLPLAWLAISWAVARPLLSTDAEAGDFTLRFAVPDPAATLTLLPVLALVLVTSLASVPRWWRWWGTVAGVVALAVSLGTLGLSMQGIADVATGGQAFTVGTVTAPGTVSDYRNPDVHWRAPGLTRAWPQPRPDGSLGMGQYATLRDWTALANAAGEVAARVEADEVLVVSVPAASLEVRPLEALLGGRVRVRQVPRVVLPLEREAVYIVTATPGSAALPMGDLRTPSSSVGVYAPAGADTGVRILTVRPRTEADWLAGAQLVPNGQFADGSTFLAYDLDFERGRPVRVRTYWRLAEASPVTPQAVHIGVYLPDSCLVVQNDDRPMPVISRRMGEITVASFAVQANAGPTVATCALNPRGTLQVELRDRARTAIPWSGGQPRMPIPLRPAEPAVPPPPPPTPAPAPSPAP